MQNNMVNKNCTYTPYLKGCTDMDKCRFNLRLSSAVGHYVSVNVRSLGGMDMVEGVLFEVGSNYIMLYDCDTGTYTVLELGSICCVTIFPPDFMPGQDNENGSMDDNMGDNMPETLPVMGFSDNSFMDNMGASEVFNSFSTDEADSFGQFGLYNDSDIGVG